jgi:hypothetical protein
MVLLFLIKSSPDREEIKKIKNPAVKQLANSFSSAIKSRLIETIDAVPFEKAVDAWSCFEKFETVSNINSLYYNIIGSNRTVNWVTCQYEECHLDTKKGRESSDNQTADMRFRFAERRFI